MRLSIGCRLPKINPSLERVLSIVCNLLASDIVSIIVVQNSMIVKRFDFVMNKFLSYQLSCNSCSRSVCKRVEKTLMKTLVYKFSWLMLVLELGF